MLALGRDSLAKDSPPSRRGMHRIFYLHQSAPPIEAARPRASAQLAGRVFERTQTRAKSPLNCNQSRRKSRSPPPLHADYWVVESLGLSVLVLLLLREDSVD